MATTHDTRKPLGILAPDGRNYLAWAARVKTNARKEGVYKHLLAPDDGGTARPVTAGNAQTKWDEDDGDAQSQILKLLDDQGVARVSALDTAHEIWDFLKKKYQNTGEAEMQQARTTLGNTRFKYNNKITDLIDTVNELFAVFDGSGAPLHDNEKIRYVNNILKGAGGRWQRIADTCETELKALEKQDTAQAAAYNVMTAALPPLAGGAAYPAPPSISLKWDDVKTTLEREQRDRDLGTGAWTNERFSGNGFQSGKGRFTSTTNGGAGNGYHRAHRALVTQLIDNGIEEELATEIAASAMSTNTDDNHNSNRTTPIMRRPAGMTCYNCGKQGHSKDVCKSAPGCAPCNTNDHRHYDCPKRFRRDFSDRNNRDNNPSPPPMANQAQAPPQAIAPVANAAATTDTRRDRAMLAAYDAFKAAGGAAEEFISMIAHIPTRIRKWIIDSGASKHMTFNGKELTHNYSHPTLSVDNRVNDNDNDNDKTDIKHAGIKIADNSVINVESEGVAKINNGIDNGTITLNNTLHAPSLGENLLSINTLSQEGKRVTFEPFHGPVFISQPTNREELMRQPPGNIIGLGHHDGQVWTMGSSDKSLLANGDIACRVDMTLTHERFGHLGLERLKRVLLKQLERKYAPQNIPDHKRREILSAMMQFCEMCEIANSKKNPIHRKSNDKPTYSRATAPNYRFYIDACIVNVEARTGAVLFITLVDCMSRWGEYAGLKNRRDVYEMFLVFQAQVEKQLNTPIKKIRCDNAPEYVSGRLYQHLREQGIQYEKTTPESSAMNAVAERRIRAIQEIIRVNLTRANLGDEYWDDAGREANIIINETPTIANNWKSPYEVRFEIIPDTTMVRTFGCPAFVHLNLPNRENKIGPRAIKGIYIGRDIESRAWIVQDPHTKKTYSSKDVTFDESFASGHSQGRIERGATGPRTTTDMSLTFERLEGPMGGEEGLEQQPIQPSTMVTENTIHPFDNMIPQSQVRIMPQTIEPPRDEPPQVDTQPEPIIRQSTRNNIGQAPERLIEIVNYTSLIGDVDETIDNLNSLGMNITDIVTEYAMRARTTPDAYTDIRPIVMAAAEILKADPKFLIEIQSMDDPDKEGWMQPTQAEYDSLIKNGTWVLEPLPPGRKPIGCKWVWKTKLGETGEIVKRKARLVAKGFTQRYGVDYNDTWAPTAKQSSVRTVLSIANAKGWLVKHSDVPSAYLKATLNELIYMEQPEGFVVPGKETWVCRLLKSLYGLKQAGLEWYNMISTKLIEWGYKRNRVDKCVFTRHDDSGSLVSMLALHVDDSLFGIKDEKEEKRIRDLMMNEYKAEIEDAHFFCGIRIEHDRTTKRMFLSQEAYIDQMIEKFSMVDARIIRTPMDDREILTKDMEPTTEEEKEKMREIPYTSLVGAIMWPATMTRPDILAAYQTLTKFNKNPGMKHWNAALRVLKYLKGTKKYGMLLDGCGITFSMGDDGKEIIDQPIQIYADADYAGDLDDRKSTSGLYVQIAGGMICARAKKQGCVTLATMEAELVALSLAIQHHEEITAFLDELGFKCREPAIIHEDNQSAIAYTRGGKNESKARHLGVRFHYIKENVEGGKVKIVYCPTKEMLADIFTKAIPADQFEYLRNGIRIVDLPRIFELRRLGKQELANSATYRGEWECENILIESG
jgi:hypothetical protein